MTNMSQKLLGPLMKEYGHSLTHCKYTHQPIVETVYKVLFWLNCFPHINDIDPMLNSHAIVTRSHIDYQKCNLEHMSKYINTARYHRHYSTTFIGKCTMQLLIR